MGVGQVTEETHTPPAAIWWRRVGMVIDMVAIILFVTLTHRSLTVTVPLIVLFAVGMLISWRGTVVARAPRS